MEPTPNTEENSMESGSPGASGTFRYEDVFPALPSSGTEASIGRQQGGDRMKIGSSNQSKIVRIPFADRSEKFGEDPANCAGIMKETGTTIEMVTSKDQSLTFLIQGKPTGVALAEKKIRQRFNPQRTVTIPREFHKTIVGKSGNRLRELERRTGTLIKIPKLMDNSDIITVTGAKEDVDRAVEELRSISDEAARQATDWVEVAKADLPFVTGSSSIGASSSKIQALQESTKTYIHVSRDSDPCKITISGEKPGVQSAKEKIHAILNKVKKYTKVSIQVPRPQHKYVSGSRNQGVNEILAETGVYVDIPTNDEEDMSIELRGPQDKVAQALNMVYSKASSVVMKTIDAPTWKRRHVIGAKGATIQKITQDYPKVNVDLKDKSSDKIVIEGPTEEVAKVAAEVQAIVDSLHCEELLVNELYHKHIIGKSGSNVKRINETNGVTVSTFDSTSPRAEGKVDATKKGIIRIEGPKEGVLNAKKEIQELVDKMENETEKSLSIDSRLYGHLIGSNGEKIKEVRDKFNQVQISIPKKSDSADKSDVVRIRGDKKSVNECYKHLSKIADELRETSYSIQVEIYKPCHKLIIGKGGANIKKVREDTQTKIDVPGENEDSNLIRISGRKENVERAKEQILKISQETMDLVTEDVVIPYEFHTSLIGPKGRGVRAITEDCGGVIIKFPPSGSNKNEVTVRGPKDDVARAKEMLLSAAEDCKLCSFEAEVRVDPQLRRFLSRRSGGIKGIMERTRARIILPSDRDDDKELITITGKEESVMIAKEELEAFIKEVSNIVVDHIDVDPKHHKYFVTRRGEVVNRISDECGGVKISFPQSGSASSSVSLEGTRENVDAAIEKIKEEVDERESKVTIELVVHNSKHGCMVGARGSKVLASQSEFNVHIKFPDKNRDAPEENGEPASDAERHARDVIYITGREENCLAAREALLAQVPIDVEIEVPSEYHRLISQERNDLQKQFDVRISLPPQDAKTDVIKVSGCPSSIEELKATIESRIDDYKLNSFEVKFEVDPQYHSKIIGAKGAVIRKIRTDHNVKINLPPREDPDNPTISVIGLEANALAARDEILQIVHKLVNMVREEVEIDSRVHSRLIGRRAFNINKVMDQYGVEITIPRKGDARPNTVTIQGSNEDDVLGAKEHLLNLAEEYMQDILDDEVPAPSLRISSFATVFSNAAASGADGAAGAAGEQTSDSGRGGGGAVADNRKNGFVVTGAPWEQKAPDMQSNEDFPSFGGSPSGPPGAGGSWGPSTHKWGGVDSSVTLL